MYARNGENLSATELGPYVCAYNLFTSLGPVVSPRALQEMQDHFADGTEGSITFSAGGAAETLCYVPIEGTDWEMVVLITESVIHDRIRDISEGSLSTSRKLIVLTLALVLVFAAILLYQYKMLSGHKLEAEKENSRTFLKMANTDSMTGIRNKYAYSEHEEAINAAIREKQIENLAVVVCDINGLKYVNDTKGHAAGDRLIKDACNMICTYFDHGAVFRIGGDEFVVLLQDLGYETMHEAISAFNAKAEENIENDEAVVSIGYAEWTPEDKQLHDVFERADQMIKKKKKELKEMGAKTR